MKFEELLPYLREGKIGKKNGMFIKIKGNTLVYSPDPEFRYHLTSNEIIFAGSYILEDGWELIEENDGDDWELCMTMHGLYVHRIEPADNDDIIASINLEDRSIVLFDEMLKKYNVNVIIENV